MTIGFAYESLTTDLAFLPEHQIVRQKQRANRDAGVCDIEGWPMIRTRMHGDEINHVSQPGAVSQISDYACQQERTSSQDAVVVSWRAQEIIEDSYRGKYGQHHKKPAPKAPTFLQLTESDAAILRINQVQEAVNNCPILSEAKRAYGPRLGRLVNHVEAETCQQVTGAPAKAS
jgi:hypothetical protein